MGTPVGGSIRRVWLDSQIFSVAADADATIDLGGFNGEVQPNGDRTGRKIMSAVNWRITGLMLAVDDDAANQETVQGIANDPNWVPVVIEMASGVKYQGAGTVTDAVERSTQSATMSVSLAGPGELIQQ